MEELNPATGLAWGTKLRQHMSTGGSEGRDGHTGISGLVGGPFKAVPDWLQ